MDTLVLCPCGHAMASHDWEGCRGDRHRRCGCPHSRLGALEAAIYASRLRAGSATAVLPAE